MIPKFRAYHKEMKKMYYFNIMWGNHSKGNGYIGMVEIGKEKSENGYRDNVVLIDPYECELMQSTGLHDKNGKEIYKDDIVKHKNGDIFKIIWNQLSFKMDGEKEIRNMFDRSGEFITIIGNIYENPELKE